MYVYMFTVCIFVCKYTFMVCISIYKYIDIIYIYICIYVYTYVYKYIYDIYIGATPTVEEIERYTRAIESPGEIQSHGWLLVVDEVCEYIYIYVPNVFLTCPVSRVAPCC
jgi:hypothetical protein